jgi:cytochrome c
MAFAAPTKDDAFAIVESAASFASKNGKDKLIEEVNKKDGSFSKGDLYVFVYDSAGTLLANPVAQPLIGKNLLSQPDADGKLFRKEIIQVTAEKGSGWVNYKYKDPASGAIEPKASYVKKQGDIIIGAGIYLK